VVTLLMLGVALTMLAVGDFIPVRFYADVSSIADIARSSALTRVVDAVHSLDVPIGQARLPPYRRWCRTRSCGRPGAGVG